MEIEGLQVGLQDIHAALTPEFLNALAQAQGAPAPAPAVAEEAEPEPAEGPDI